MITSPVTPGVLAAAPPEAPAPADLFAALLGHFLADAGGAQDLPAAPAPDAAADEAPPAPQPASPASAAQLAGSLAAALTATQPATAIPAVAAPVPQHNAVVAASSAVAAPQVAVAGRQMEDVAESSDAPVQPMPVSDDPPRPLEQPATPPVTGQGAEAVTGETAATSSQNVSPPAPRVEPPLSPPIGDERPPAAAADVATRAAGLATGTADLAGLDLGASNPAAEPAGSSSIAGPGSALAQRIADAVEALEHAPPPQRMVVDLGDARLSVSLHGDAVRVALLDGGAVLATPSWRTDVAAALAARGFALRDDAAFDERGGARGGHPGADERDAPRPTPRSRRATRPATGGWRL